MTSATLEGQRLKAMSCRGILSLHRWRVLPTPPHPHDQHLKHAANPGNPLLRTLVFALFAVWVPTLKSLPHDRVFPGGTLVTLSSNPPVPAQHGAGATATFALACLALRAALGTLPVGFVRLAVADTPAAFSTSSSFT